MPRRSKSFKNWFREITKVTRDESSRRIASKEKDIERWKDNLSRLKVTRGNTFEGYPREDYIKLAESSVRQLIGAIAKDQKILESLDRREVEDDLIKDKIQNHSSIEKIFIGTDNRIHIHTKNLKSGKDAIGKYVIKYSPSSKSFEIRNKTYIHSQEPSKAHWAVHEGKPCMGDWSTGIMNYAKEFEIYLLADSWIRFLTMAGDTNAYMRKPNWIKYLKKKVPSNDSEKESLEADGIVTTENEDNEDWDGEDEDDEEEEDQL
jgi:hypothetical protein